jgi:hypothetical protein
MSEYGKTLITIGVALVIAGFLLQRGGLNWIGRLPGDLRIGNTTILLGTSIALSLLLTLLLNLWRLFTKK